MKAADGLKALVEARTSVAQNWKDCNATYLVPQEKELVAQATR